MQAIALARFFQALGTLVVMKNGGQPNDLSKLLNYARLGVLAGDKGREHLELAVAKVDQLVAEDRSLTEQELADLDTSIRSKLARAAGVQIPELREPEPAPTTPPSTDAGTAGTDPPTP